jgi:hypothetical protein
VTAQFVIVEQDLARLVTPVIDNTAVKNTTVYTTTNVALGSTALPAANKLTTTTQHTQMQELPERTRSVQELPTVVSSITKPEVATVANQSYQSQQLTEATPTALASPDITTAIPMSTQSRLATSVTAAPIQSEQITDIMLLQAADSDSKTTAVQSDRQSSYVVAGTQEHHSSLKTAILNLHTDADQATSLKEAAVITHSDMTPITVTATGSHVLNDVHTDTPHEFDVDTPRSPLSPILEQADTWQVPTAVNLLPRSKFDAVLKIATAAGSEWDSESEINSPVSSRPQHVSGYGDLAADSSVMMVEVDDF